MSFTMVNMINSLDLIKEKINNSDTLFFDLDGVIINTEPLYFRFWKEAALFYGFKMSDEQALAMRSRDRTSAKEFVESISNGQLDYVKTREKRTELMNQYFETHPIEIKPGISEFLRKMRLNCKKLYIVTANMVDKTERILKQIKLEEFFDGVISARDVKRGKPYPFVYLEACRQVNKNPYEVVVFEDSPNGLLSSFSAGCFTVMVEDMTPYSDDMDYVDGVIQSFIQLI